jgi:hypothetical protein
VGQEQRAAQSADSRKDKGGGAGTETAGLDAPFENGKGNNQQHKKAVLSHIGNGKTLPKAFRTQRPVLRVSA